MIMERRPLRFCVYLITLVATILSLGGEFQRSLGCGQKVKKWEPTLNPPSKVARSTQLVGTILVEACD